MVTRMASHVALVLCLMLGWSSCAWALSTVSPEPEAESPNVRVGVYVSPPFVMRDGSGRYSGMAIDLWEGAATRLDWQFEYVEKSTFGDLMDAVAANELDVAVTNLTVTQKRAERIDFTHPWYDAGLRVMISDDSSGHGRLWTALYESGHMRTYAGLAVLMVMATLLLTFFDRRYDAEFSRKWGEGFAESFYHVVSVATSGKTTRKKMFGAIGRVLAAVWMMCGVALIAYITSSITSVMTTTSLTRAVNGVGDLPGKTIGVLTGSTAENFAGSMQFDFRQHPNIEGAVQALSHHAIVAVVADAPVLEYYAHTRRGEGVSVVGNIFSPQKYAFGVRRGSGLAKPLTVELLGMHESGKTDEIRSKYFGPRH